MAIFEKPFSRPEKEIVHLLPQFFISEKNEQKKEEDKTDEQPKYPVRQTFCSGGIRCLLGYYVSKKLYHISQPGVPNILGISTRFVNPKKVVPGTYFQG
jgi:hypothetical protein